MSSWTSEDWQELGYGGLWILGSFGFFHFVQYLVRWYLFGKFTFKASDKEKDSSSESKSYEISDHKAWRICNEAVSFIHSIVSGIWAAYALLFYTELLNDMMFYRCTAAANLLFLTTGYLLHDFTDLLINEKSLRIIELLFHHFVVLIAVAICFGFKLFLGIIVCGLLMEINSIFLHSRSILNLYGTNKRSPQYRMVAMLNMLTLIVFRLAVSVYLMYWSISNIHKCAWYYWILPFFIVISLCSTNTVLTYRIMAADGMLGSSRGRPSQDESSPSSPPSNREAEEQTTNSTVQ